MSKKYPKGISMRFLFACALALTVSGPSQALTLNFSDLEQAGDSYVLMNHYESSGFKIEHPNPLYPEDPDLFGTWGSSHPEYDASAALFNNYGGETSRISATNGGTFGLVSMEFDLLFYEDYFDPNGFPLLIEVRGFDASGVELARQEVVLESDGWSAVNFSDAFRSIAYAEWIQAYPPEQTYGFQIKPFQFDNVVLSPVPEANIATMLIAGCCLLTAVGRRR
ncbi:hypothetical protein [Nitrogeniibacter aestuarii]|uniref:hypothetical protein n=1 Tax=Nitrogeniibacter aestuarii TaxID=2815343 RepID=UPI001D124B66|nr:hypothetical protein [Nitrogeniibacter aestuarii]